MAKVVVLGAGISGHTAATHLKRKLGEKHEVVVVSPNAKWNWIPSNIWVGVGLLQKEDVTFELAPVYKKQRIVFKQAQALALYPDGEKPCVEIEWTRAEKKGQREKIDYDFLVNATGPKLNFGMTEGLGPEFFTESVCSAEHALGAAQALNQCIEKMKKGKRQKILIGVGHGLCTCQGAAFEYVFNVEHELRRQGVRDLADITFITNEYELGDFGIGGAHFKRGGYYIHSKTFAESLYSERGINWVKRAHVQKIEKGKIYYENLEGDEGEIEFDFSMLLPPFKGQDLRAYSSQGVDITEKIFAPNGFMKVDADYSGKSYENWEASDWPKTYQNPVYPNVFAVGIAFAPPHAISKPMKNKKGTPINPTPPRTGMPSGIMGKTVALSIADFIKKGEKAGKPSYSSPFAKMAVACVASAGSGLKGSAAAITMYPVVPDFKKYPEHGRDMSYTFGEIGLAGHWIKKLLHYMFIYKAKCRPGWFLIPE